MTIAEVIAKTDELSPNQYSTDQKIGWLSTLDGQIYHSIIMTHDRRCCYFFPPDGYDTDDYDLIIKPPYAEDIYVNYLLSRIAQANSEITKYNQYAALHNQALDSWTAWYTQTHMPITRGRWKL